MAFKNQINALTLSLFDTTTIDGTFQVLSGGITEACYMLRFINASDKDVAISFDGVNEHDYVRAGETIQIPSPAQSIGLSGPALFGKGTKVWVQGSIAGTGLVYLGGYYQNNN